MKKKIHNNLLYPQSSNANPNISIISALQIAFIIGKLTGLINWSWWWVFSPILIPTGMLFALLLLALALAIISEILFGERS